MPGRSGRVGAAMGLTSGGGPLSPHPPRTVNYAVTGPAHKLLAQPFPRRVRAEFAGRTVLDTRRGLLLHETAILPQLYVPEDDLDPADVLDAAALDPTTRTVCSYKGEADHWTVRLPDGRELTDAAWGYPRPLPEAAALVGRICLLHDELRTLVDGEPA